MVGFWNVVFFLYELLKIFSVESDVKFGFDSQILNAGRVSIHISVAMAIPLNSLKRALQ
jgi:hypothetical protein